MNPMRAVVMVLAGGGVLPRRLLGVVDGAFVPAGTFSEASL